MKFSSNILILYILFIISCSSSPDGRSELRLGNKKYSQGQYNDAESKYIKSIERNNSIEALYGRGNTVQRQAFYSSKEKQDTLDSIANILYQQCIDIQPTNKLKLSDIYHNQGNLFYTNGLRSRNLQDINESNNNFSKAAECYKSALRLEPNDSETRYNLAMALYMIKDNQNNQDNKEQDKKEQDKKDNKGDNNEDRDKKPDEKNGQDEENNKKNKDDYNQGNKKPIDARTANQLLNAAQQDENRVHRKLEHSSQTNFHYEKDW